MPDFAKIDKKSVYTTIIGLFLMAALSLTKIIPELSLSGLTVLIGILFFFVLEHFDKKSHLCLLYTSDAADDLLTVYI